MQFKSVRFSLNAFSSKFAAAAFCVAAAVSQSAFAPFAQATMTVTPVNGGTAQGGTGGVSENIYYSAIDQSTGLLYAAESGTSYSPTPYIDSADTSQVYFQGITLGKSSPNQGNLNSDGRSNQLTPQATNMLVFNVSSSLANPTVPSGSNLAIAVYFFQSDATTFTPVLIGNTNSTPLAPIAWVGSPNLQGADCVQGSNCYNAGLSGTYGSPGPPVAHSYAVPYSPQTTVTIGLYPADMCNDFVGEGFISNTGGSGCGSDGTLTDVNVPVAATTTTTQTPTTMFVAFALVTVPGGGGSQISTSNGGTVLDSAAVQLSFQFDPIGNTLCPSNLNTAYIPGDGQITLPTGSFGGDAPRATNDAPINELIVVGSLYQSSSSSLPSIDIGSDFSTNSSVNTIVDRVPLGPAAKLGNFQNTDNGSDNYYYLAFLTRDSTGLVSTANLQSCALEGVQTSKILGFLQSSRCFIATAAFRSMDAPPVAMLRHFRDHFLLKHSWGHAFVDWYYSWSPHAAQWLLHHPVFEVPVLAALTPLELFAWVILNPALALGLSAAAFLLLSYAALRRARF